jgi:hypothetical protein
MSKFRNKLQQHLDVAAEQDKNEKKSVREKFNKHISAAAEQNTIQTLDEIEANLKKLEPQSAKLEDLISSGKIKGKKLLERAQAAIELIKHSQKEQRAIQMAIDSRRYSIGQQSKGGRRKSRRRRQSNNNTRKYK